MRLTLSACPPFSLRALIASHGWAYLPPFAVDAHNVVLGRIERLSTGRVVELRIRQTTDGVAVETQEWLEGLEREEVARKAWWMLRLGEDLTPFYEAVRGEPRLSHVEEQGLGRILRSPTVFEDAVKVLLTTNVSWTRTVQMVEALVSEYGDPLPADPSRHAFPTPAQLAGASETELRAIGIGYRAPNLLDLAQRVASGELDLEQLKDGGLGPAEGRALLRSIRGMGKYAVALLSMLVGWYDLLPIDSVARRRVSEARPGGQAATAADVEQAFARWGEWKGLAYWWWEWPSSTLPGSSSEE